MSTQPSVFIQNAIKLNSKKCQMFPFLAQAMCVPRSPLFYEQPAIHAHTAPSLRV